MRQPRVKRRRPIAARFPFRVESLEDRRLLAETPILISGFDSPAEPSNPRDFTRVGDTLYYVVSTGPAGANNANTELWKEVDGVRSMVRNIAPGDTSSVPQLLTPIGDFLYFTANDGQGRKLWRSDGSFDGTVPVGGNVDAITEFRGGVYVLSSGLFRLDAPFQFTHLASNVERDAGLTALGDTALLFSAVDASFGEEPFVSDGTREGTHILKNVRDRAGSSIPRGFYEWHGHVYFSARSVPAMDGVLWRTDGTEAGTELVSQAVVRDGPQFANTDDKLAVIAQGGLYFTDGTSAGTFNVPVPADVRFGFDTRQPGRFVGAGDNVYFYPRSAAGFEVWTSDGTAEGTRLVRDIAPGAANSDAREFTSFGGKMYFVADSPTLGTELWVTDGTTEGTIPLTDFSTAQVDVPINELFVDKGGVHFIAYGSQLWRTNGTVAGTMRVADLGFVRTGTSIDDFVAVGATLLFVRRDPQSSELWSSDGATANTAILHPDIRDVDQHATPLAWNGFTYFAARTDALGMELWRTDGTAAGTTLVRDIIAGAVGSNPANFFEFQGLLYFTARDGAHGVELWRTDGTPEGTELVQDIRVGAESSSPSDFVELNGNLYFAASGSIHGNELWRTDGSSTGAVMVRDINPGSASSNPRQLTVVGNQIFMQTTHAPGLWKSDGTLAGTRPVLYGGPSPDNLTAFQGELFYTDSTGGLWKTDGTEFGSLFVQTTAGINRTEGITIFDGAMYFTARANSSAGNQLWRSDGTTAGTKAVSQIGSAGTYAGVRSLTAVGDQLFFIADDGVVGPELWQTDGTAPGTELAFDLRPGPVGAELTYLTDMAGALYFAGNDGLVGNGLWTLADSDDLTPPQVAGVYNGATQLASSVELTERPLEMTFSFSETMSEIGGAGGIRSALNLANYRLLDGVADVSARLDFALSDFNAARNAYEVTLRFTEPLTNGNYTLIATTSLRDVAGNDLDGDADGVAGGEFAIAFEVNTPVAIGEEFRINQTTAADQRTHATTPQAVAADVNGDFVATWTSYNQDGDGGGIYARRYRGDGLALGNEFRVNTTTALTQRNATIAMDPDGDFVITWSSEGQDGEGYGVYAQLFSADGTPRGGEFLVNQTTVGHQRFSLVAMDDAGNFAVTWTGVDADTLGIYLRRFDAEGNALGDEMLVNETQSGAQRFSNIAMAADGRFAVVWSGPSPLAQGDEVYARLYAADGTPSSGEFQVNAATSGSQQAAVVAMDDAGNFAVAWQSVTGSDGGDILLRQFDAAGTPLRGDVLVPTVIAGVQRSPMIAMDGDGDFAVAWSSANQDGSGYGSYVRRYSASGLSVTAALPVNVETVDQQVHPSIVLDRDGEMLVVWSSLGQDGSGYGFYGRRFAPASPVSGDTNGDLSVDIEDLNNVRNNFGAGGTGVLGDTNGDDVVNVEDLNAVRNNFGVSAGAPLSVSTTAHAGASLTRSSLAGVATLLQRERATWDLAILEFLKVEPLKLRTRK